MRKMFDTYRIQSGPSSINATVTEKRAPTDESVRLLREMESAAFGQILQRIVLESNEFKGTIYVHKSASTYEDFVTCVFELNGKRMTARALIGEDKFKTGTALIKAVAEQIAEESLIPLFHKVL